MARIRGAVVSGLPRYGAKSVGTSKPVRHMAQTTATRKEVPLFVPDFVKIDAFAVFDLEALIQLFYAFSCQLSEDNCLPLYFLGPARALTAIFRTFSPSSTRIDRVLE